MVHILRNTEKKGWYLLCILLCYHSSLVILDFIHFLMQKNVFIYT